MSQLYAGKAQRYWGYHLRITLVQIEFVKIRVSGSDY
jgi:hypothetical protein